MITRPSTIAQDKLRRYLLFKLLNLLQGIAERYLVGLLKKLQDRLPDRIF